MGARYRGGACLGSFVGDRRRRLFEPALRPTFPQSARAERCCKRGGPAFLQRGSPDLAQGCLIRRLRNGSAYWGTPAANTRTSQAVGAAESDPTATSLDRAWECRQDTLFRSIDPERTTMHSKMAPWAFVLAVPDINKSAQYFHDFLGFRISWENATDWRLAERDGVRIMLGQCPNDM